MGDSHKALGWGSIKNVTCTTGLSGCRKLAVTALFIPVFRKKQGSLPNHKDTSRAAASHTGRCSHGHQQSAPKNTKDSSSFPLMKVSCDSYKHKGSITLYLTEKSSSPPLYELQRRKIANLVCSESTRNSFFEEKVQYEVLSIFNFSIFCIW
jgi:hypothetical protein